MRRKSFDCLEMKHRGSLRIYEETRDLSREELLAYWAQRDQELVELQRALRARREQAPSAGTRVCR